MRDERDTPPLEFSPDRLEEYLGRYRDLFARADQRGCFGSYVCGLLTAAARKNVEGIAAVATPGKPGANLAQALQHFVSQSPWDHGRVLARYRELLPPGCRNPTAWVVHDGVLLKKGRNSVGTQRQFARSLGRKVNCQVAVVVGAETGGGYAPLALRLYLPGYWLREHGDLVRKTVPEDYRAHVPKPAIALAILDELRAGGWAADRAVLDEGYRASGGFVEVLTERRITPADDPGGLDAAAERFEWLKNRLGLDHFEGRNWVGWHHHAAMVLVAAGFLFAAPR